MIKGIEAGRLVKVKVKGKSPIYLVRLMIVSEDRVGLARDIVNVMAENSINISTIYHGIAKDGILNIDLVIEIERYDQLDYVLSELENVPSVRRAYRVNLGSS